MIRALFWIIAPFLTLLFITCIACVFGYFVAYFLNNPDALRKSIIRISQILLLLSIFPITKYLQLNKKALGFASFSQLLKQFNVGLGVGLITLLPVFIILYALDVLMIDENRLWTLSWFFEKLGLNFLLALLIGCVEELIFRSLLFASLQKQTSLITAMLASSLYYAGLHFLDAKMAFSETNFTVLSGFSLLSEAFNNIFKMQNWDAFLALFTVGLFLATLRANPRTNLAICIGCHTSWVWQLKLGKLFFNTDFNADYAFLVSHYDGVVGKLVTLCIGTVLICYFCFKFNKNALSIHVKT